MSDAPLASTISRSGAETLAERIRRFWRSEGFEVEPVVVQAEGGVWTIGLDFLDPATGWPKRGTPRVGRSA